MLIFSRRSVVERLLVREIRSKITADAVLFFYVKIDRHYRYMAESRLIGIDYLHSVLKQLHSRIRTGDYGITCLEDGSYKCNGMRIRLCIVPSSSKEIQGDIAINIDKDVSKFMDSLGESLILRLQAIVLDLVQSHASSDKVDEVLADYADDMHRAIKKHFIDSIRKYECDLFETVLPPNKEGIITLSNGAKYKLVEVSPPTSRIPMYKRGDMTFNAEK
jgi:hypothetical protein